MKKIGAFNMFFINIILLVSGSSFNIQNGSMNIEIRKACLSK